MTQWLLGIVSEPPGHLIPIDIGQVDIQQDYINVLTFRNGYSLKACARLKKSEAFVLENAPDESQIIRVVLDIQDGSHNDYTCASLASSITLIT